MLAELFVFFLVFLLGLLVFWHLTRKDGFNEEKSVDLYIVTIVAIIFFARFFAGTNSYFGFKESLVYALRIWDYQSFLIIFDSFVILGMLFGFLAAVALYSKLWKWSFFRISDSFAIAFCAILSTLSIYFVNISFALIYFGLFILFFLKKHRLRSGLTFSLFLFAHIFLDLKLYVVLVIIGFVNLYFRERKNIMISQLPSNFISRAKQLLTKKEKEIDVEQKSLLSNEPYMEKGRDADNEYLDDVQEDIQQQEHDLKVSALRDMKIRVRKALAKIKIGSYGVCDVCGQPIGIERLKAYPEATTCVKHSA